ncbi:uncharacterized protein DUF3180 [Jatrophihabitans sp. GAS493]|uniref:DUF3180 domain-containing protein n=1 Tax=Jatrophihabitans sp. GAS493 TaxID=1907575 RepID=UPI000BB833A5|nr:DUF3180 domain-containing protein [Jatrophihabitans sp. GAS493]SOD70563.1 uncharacterized protein DUF3180 [Jatrophihabitans sp. GAS493]
MIRRTSVLDLAIPFVLVLGVVRLALRGTYGSLAPLSYFVPIPLIALAIVEFAIAKRVRDVINHEADAKVMTAIAIARCAALGKASALGAAAVGGAFAAMLLRVLPIVSTVSAARHDATVSAFGLAASALLLGAGLLLERSAIIPNDPKS